MITRGFSAFKDFVYPDACCLCGEIDGFFSHRPVKIMLGAKEIQSPYCFSCTRSLLKGFEENKFRISERSTAITLFDYTHESVQKAIFHIKKTKCLKCINFFAEIIGDTVKDTGIQRITYIPRSRKHYKTYGFDQSDAVISTFVRDCDNIKLVELFERNRHHSKPQKTLSYDDRFINAKRSLQLRSDADIPKSIIVFDDVMTTGATAETAAELLKAGGADNIVLLFLAGAKIIIEERRKENE